LTNGAHIREEDLELYALGALPEDEAAAVRTHVAGCGECTRKLAEAHGSVALLAFAAPQERPPAAVKEKLFARIAAERGSAGEIAGVVQRETGEQRELYEPRRPAATVPWWNWVLVPAALALAVLSLLLSWQNRKLGAELQMARSAATQFEKERMQVETMVRVLAAPDTITVRLAGTADASQARGLVRYNPRTGMVLYSAEGLPTLPAEKIYQMWLVPANGAPVSAGIFAPGGAAEPLWTAQVPLNTEPKAFAVTIEPAGGVPAPTGAKVLLGAS